MISNRSECHSKNSIERPCNFIELKSSINQIKYNIKSYALFYLFLSHVTINTLPFHLFLIHDAYHDRRWYLYLTNCDPNDTL